MSWKAKSGGSWGRLGMKFDVLRFDEVSINFDKKRIPLSTMERSKRKGTYRYYGAQGVIDYIDDYIFDGEYLLIAEDGENLKSKKQNIAQLVKGQFWVNNHAHIIQTNERCDLRFLNYLINSMDLSGYITGSAQPKLSQANLNALELNIPERGIQDKIVSIIGSLDDKIAINERINENLLQQATILFHMLFDKYDTISSCIVSLSELARFKYGTMPKKDKIGTGYYLAFSGYQVIGTYPEKMFDDPQLVIVARGVGGCGDIKYTPENCFLTNLSIAILASNSAVDDYLFHYLRLHDTKIMNTGSAQPQITISTLEKYLLPFPSEDDLVKFSNMIQPMKEMYRKLSNESRLLSSLRDALLPKLMSGELDVSNL